MSNTYAQCSLLLVQCDGVMARMYCWLRLAVTLTILAAVAGKGKKQRHNKPGKVVQFGSVYAHPLKHPQSNFKYLLERCERMSTVPENQL